MSNIKIFCPFCKEEVECRPRGSASSGFQWYKGHCAVCEKDVYIEDRSSYEQSGEIEIILC